MISKELLSEVLDESVTEIQSLESPSIFGSKQLWITSRSHDCAINLYELAHKCKEWALQNGYLVTSSLRNIVIHKGDKSIYTDITNNETQSIFKACQWILDKDKR